MSDNQKEAPASNFDLTGDGSAMYDSDSQLRTAIIQRLLNEYRTTNYFLANAMQSTFLRFFVHDSYTSIPPPEFNRPKSDSNYYEPKNQDHIKIEELNIKSGSQFNEYCFTRSMSKLDERRTDMIYGPRKFSKNNGDSFRFEFDTISTNSQRQEEQEEEESVLLTGRTMHVGGYTNSCYSNRSSLESEKDFQFVDTDMNNQIQRFEEKPSSVKSTESSEQVEEDEDITPPFYPQWKKINKGKDKIQQHSAHSSRRGGEKTISCSFNDSNRSSIDNYNDDTHNSSDRKESSCNKGKCKPSEFVSKGMSDKKSNNHDHNHNNTNTNNNNDEFKVSSKRETKWQVFCDLYEELNSSLKEQNTDDYTASSSSESIKSSVKYYDSNKTSTHSSSLERKINVAINKLKVKEPDVSKTKKIKNTENLRLKFNSRYNKKSYIEDTSSDTEEVLIRNRYLKNKRIYNTKKYFTNKFKKTKKRKTQIELLTSTTSSDDNDFFTPRQTNTSTINLNTDTQHQNTSPTQKQQKFPENLHKIPCQKPVHKISQVQQKCAEMTEFQQMCADTHKMNDKLIHETIFENSEEEQPYPQPPFPSYFETFMVKYNKNYELMHKKGCTNLAARAAAPTCCGQESSTITSCDDYSKNNHYQSSFNLVNETSCRLLHANANNNSNMSLIDKIANSGHSTSSFDSIDDKSVPLPCTTAASSSNSEDMTQRNPPPPPPEELTKISTSTICLKSSTAGVDSGIGASVSEIKPIENVFIIKKPNRNRHLSEITVVEDESAVEKVSGSNTSSEWSKICKAKFPVSKLPFRFSSSSKSKSSSENECKPKMRVIFKREATVIDLFNSVSREDSSVLSLNERNRLDLRKPERVRCCYFRNLFYCCCNKKLLRW